ncbi:uncharacterized protein EI90DRAFT_1328659 [Cantharellus anzutake]|uniref:uncharacterized protein n=1 Tax=Cantharellus anzutake TaxID=1750568 RepID=UPI001904A5B6|nr:uncharacterized protein EI90DRAFT_1328659 [Cantharellus anzutake]KAF8342299.1 hypothetical protein EI90DRAFT_1328659 [Cantharellus anzutake]
MSGEQSDKIIETPSSIAAPHEHFLAQKGAVANAFPQLLVDDLEGLNTAVANFCSYAAEWTLENWPFESIEPSTADVNLDVLKTVFPGGCAIPSMILSRKYAPRPLKDVINWGLRSIINKALFEEILDPFHPSLSLRVGGTEGTKRSEHLKSVFYSILYEEADVSMLHAKAGMFKSLDRLARDNPRVSPIDDILSALRDGDKGIMDLLQAVFGDRANRPPIDLDPLRSIIRVAYEWNHVAKSLVPPVDLHPFVIPNTGSFDAEIMDYHGKPVRSSGKSVIICAGSIGLKLHDRRRPKGRVLLKVEVLTPQNYGDA